MSSTEQLTGRVFSILPDSGCSPARKPLRYLDYTDTLSGRRRLILRGAKRVAFCEAAAYRTTTMAHRSNWNQKKNPGGHSPTRRQTIKRKKRIERTSSRRFNAPDRKGHLEVPAKSNSNLAACEAERVLREQQPRKKMRGGSALETRTNRGRRSRKDARRKWGERREDETGLFPYKSTSINSGEKAHAQTRGKNIQKPGR